MDSSMGHNQTSQNADMNKNRQPPIPQLVLSNRCIETQAQINQLMQVLGMTSSTVGHFVRLSEESKNPMPEGAIAVENALVACCERIEKIMHNDSLWDDTFQRRVEKEYDELHKVHAESIRNQRATTAAQLATIQAQQKAAEEVVSPHFRYRPDFKRMRDGRWMALIGDENNLEFAIFGIGTSMQAALDDFDCMFKRGVPLAVAKHLEERANSLEAGTPVPDYPNENDIKTQLDNGQNQSGGQSPEGGPGLA